ncbi:MAG: divergent polysaccharide deacetylase family protein [Woeseiaceae bacterium]|nr:divergent polysaccharide deacetylase family protein [Woeseiaceae bacterium]
MSVWRLLLIAVSLLAASARAETPVARIAIIIDDLGYGMALGQRALNLPGPVSFAVLPATPRAEALANRAQSLGKDVLLHLPLQSAGTGYTAEPGSLLLDMSRTQFADAFALALQSVPHAIGVNNHKGSLLTRHPGHMAWLMQEIHARNDLFFVDSFTTHESVALDLAREAGVPAVKRDVFLDPDRLPGTIEREFMRLKELARRRGFAIGIGHPYPVTLDLLEMELPKLEAEGIELVSISRYVSLRSENDKSTPQLTEVE